MRGRSATSWGAAVGLGLILVAVATAVFLGLRLRAARVEVAGAEARARAMEDHLKASEPRLDELQAARDELERLRKQVEELHRLRGQYQEWQRERAEYSQVKAELERLRQGGQAVPRPAAWVGIAMGTQTGNGVVVQSVVPAGPAAAAGLAAGDLITAVDGQAVAGPAEFRAAIATRQVGMPVTLDVWRNNAPVRLVITTGAFPN